MDKNETEIERPEVQNVEEEQATVLEQPKVDEVEKYQSYVPSKKHKKNLATRSVLIISIFSVEAMTTAAAVDATVEGLPTPQYPSTPASRTTPTSRKPINS